MGGKIRGKKQVRKERIQELEPEECGIRKGRGGERKGRKERPKPEARRRREGTERESGEKKSGEKIRTRERKGNQEKAIQSGFLLSPAGPTNLANAR